jgi:hypothetical protein
MLSHCKLSKLLTKSVWYVPKETLLAYETINNITRPVQDQTIWVIDSYDHGYVLGMAYTFINCVLTAKNKIVGSITPEGNVSFAFHSANITYGSGKFGKINDRWQFLMQVNDLSDLNGNIIGLSHWAYMRYLKDKSKILPGCNIKFDSII